MYFPDSYKRELALRSLEPSDEYDAEKEGVERIRGCETEDELYEVLAELMGE